MKIESAVPRDACILIMTNDDPGDLEGKHIFIYYYVKNPNLRGHDLNKLKYTQPRNVCI